MASTTATDDFGEVYNTQQQLNSSNNTNNNNNNNNSNSNYDDTYADTNDAPSVSIPLGILSLFLYI